MVQGVIPYDLGETREIVGQRLTIPQGQNVIGSFPIEQADFTCNSIRQGNLDGTFTEQRICTAQPLFGPRTGQTPTLTFELKGEPGKPRQVIVYGDKALEVVNCTWSNGDPQAGICSRSGTAVKIN